MSKVKLQETIVKVSSTAGADVTVHVRPHRVAQRLLKFGQGNAKLKTTVHTFSLPAGYACPGASQCLSRARRKDGIITDGPQTEFRCFSASQEALYPPVRAARWHNYELLRRKSLEQMVELIIKSLPRKCKIVRLHVAGDFFSQAYFDAWLDVASVCENVLFYAYTKSLPWWIARLDRVGNGHRAGALSNFVLTASVGGKHDELIGQYGLRSARVVYSETEAALAGLAIDHDDSHAMRFGPDFALLIHGPQPAGSPAAKAVASLRAQGEYGYGDKADAARKGRRLALPLA